MVRGSKTRKRRLIAIPLVAGAAVIAMLSITPPANAQPMECSASRFDLRDHYLGLMQEDIANNNTVKYVYDFAKYSKYQSQIDRC